MKRFLVFGWMILVSSIIMNAQFSVSGKVFDENDEPMVGASVILDNVRVSVTNSNGAYNFDKVESGNHLISTSFVGYKTEQEKISVKSNVTKNFNLKLDSQLTEEVVVSAYRAGQKSPIAHTNISGDEIRESSVNNDLPFLLQLAPSVVAVSESGLGFGNTSFRIRGSDPTRINITVNGVPLNDSEGQGVYWANMPDFANSVNEAQIQRGVGTSTNGSAAFGATVNFRSGSDNSVAFSEITNSAGSYNTMKNSVKMSTGLLNDRFSMEARYSNLQTDGYVRNAFADHQSMYLGGILHFDNSFLKLNIIHGDQTTGISWEGIPEDILKTDRRYNPSGAYKDSLGNTIYHKDETDNYIQTHYQASYSHAIGQNANITAGLHYTRGDGFYEQYKQNAKFSSYGLPSVVIGTETFSRTDLIRQKWMGNDFYGAILSANYDISELLKLSAGGSWSRYEGDHWGEIVWAKFAPNTNKGYRWYENNSVKDDYNAFAKATLDFGKIGVMLDLQYRGIDYIMSGVDDDLESFNQKHNYDFFNPKAGVFADITDNISSYLSFGIANREPTRTNFKDAKNDPAATPQSETLYDWELGANYRSKVLTLKTNLFYMLYNDQLVPTGEKSNTGRDIMTNVKESYRAGIEFEWAWQPIRFLRWDGSATFSQNKIQNYIETSTNSYSTTESGVEVWHTDEVVKDLGKTDIAYSPNVILGSAITVMPIKSVSISLNSKYVGSQYFDNTSNKDRKLPSYLINDLKVAYSFSPSWAKKVEISGLINNVFDGVYEVNAYGGNWYENGVEKTWASYYPMAPRHYMAQLMFRF